MNTKAFNFLKCGEWSYECFEGYFTFFDTTHKESYTLDLSKLTSSIITSICTNFSSSWDADDIFMYIKNEPWSYYCEEGKLDIHSDDNKRFVRLDLYKLTPSMFDTLLVSPNKNNRDMKTRKKLNPFLLAIACDTEEDASQLNEFLGSEGKRSFDNYNVWVERQIGDHVQIGLEQHGFDNDLTGLVKEIEDAFNEHLENLENQKYKVYNYSSREEFILANALAIRACYEEDGEASGYIEDIQRDSEICEGFQGQIIYKGDETPFEKNNLETISLEDISKALSEPCVFFFDSLTFKGDHYQDLALESKFAFAKGWCTLKEYQLLHEFSINSSGVVVTFDGFEVTDNDIKDLMRCKHDLLTEDYVVAFTFGAEKEGY